MINDNHKSPNCKIKKLAVDGMPHLCLFALRDILPGEEITYSYGDGPWPWRKQGKEKATIVSSPLQTNDKGTGERDVAQSQILAQQPTLAQVKGTLAIDEQNPDGREKALSHSLAEKTSEPQEKEAVVTNEQTEDNSGSDTEPVSLEESELDCTVPKLRRSDSVIVSEEMLRNCSESSDSSMNQSDDDYIPKSSEENSPDCSSDSLSAHMSDKIDKDEKSSASCSTYDRPVPDSTVSDSESKEYDPVSVKAVSVKTGGGRVYDKKQFCLFCGKSYAKIARHIEQIHHNETEVAKALQFPRKSKERRLQIDLLRNRGNFAHNVEVLKMGKGMLVPRRQPRNCLPSKDFAHCLNCQGFFFKTQSLATHETLQA
ncbi:uncharacterized protein LOC114649549 isoform X2 [Erpetoichthys calabaricus]|nr:uncharacterized protein LOC114649549 isoform X2 [Erpetoichthys calabaricus]